MSQARLHRGDTRFAGCFCCDRRTNARPRSSTQRVGTVQDGSGRPHSWRTIEIVNRETNEMAAVANRRERTVHQRCRALRRRYTPGVQESRCKRSGDTGASPVAQAGGRQLTSRSPWSRNPRCSRRQGRYRGAFTSKSRRHSAAGVPDYQVFSNWCPIHATAFRTRDHTPAGAATNINGTNATPTAPVWTARRTSSPDPITRLRRAGGNACRGHVSTGAFGDQGWPAAPRHCRHQSGTNHRGSGCAYQEQASVPNVFARATTRPREPKTTTIDGPLGGEHKNKVFYFARRGQYRNTEGIDLTVPPAKMPPAFSEALNTHGSLQIIYDP